MGKLKVFATSGPARSASFPSRDGQRTLRRAPVCQPGELTGARRQADATGHGGRAGRGGIGSCPPPAPSCTLPRREPQPAEAQSSPLTPPAAPLPGQGQSLPQAPATGPSGGQSAPATQGWHRAQQPRCTGCERLRAALRRARLGWFNQEFWGGNNPTNRKTDSRPDRYQTSSHPGLLCLLIGTRDAQSD